ncbi:MAG: DUF5009 domain-containing protein [Ignavibacteriales bacterium]|nr:DUF5009 domain-containing protein [Ignavibacteriales bacterium]
MSSSTSSSRLVSLDIFRGATIAGMMLVNNPGEWGHIYAPWAHAKWDGWTYTDTIFPFFLWIVGVAMMLSFAKRLERGADKGELARHVIWRAAVIFYLGLFLAGVPQLSLFFLWIAALAYVLLQLRKVFAPRSGEEPQPKSRGYIFAAVGVGLAALPFIVPLMHTEELNAIRIPGVLQRIAVCYLIAGLISLYTSTRAQIGITFALLAAYWILVKTINVPGYGVGVWTPMGNFAWYIDSHVLQGHTWRGAPAPGFDPEGIFSTIPAIATTLFGVFTGRYLRTQHTKEEKTSWMFVTGSLLMLAGLIMDNWLPINKNMWTSTYSVFMAGLALVCLSCIFWIVDVKGWARWSKPFEIYGQNAITMFVLSGVVGRLTSMKFGGMSVSIKTWYYNSFFVPVGDPMASSFLHSIAFMLFLYVIAYLMYRMKWIVKV